MMTWNALQIWNGIRMHTNKSECIFTIFLIYNTTESTETFTGWFLYISLDSYMHPFYRYFTNGVHSLSSNLYTTSLLRASFVQAAGCYWVNYYLSTVNLNKLVVQSWYVTTADVMQAFGTSYLWKRLTGSRHQPSSQVAKTQQRNHQPRESKQVNWINYEASVSLKYILIDILKCPLIRKSALAPTRNSRPDEDILEEGEIIVEIFP